MTETKTIPMVPVPLAVAKKLSKPFYGTASTMQKSFPSMARDLKQSEIRLTPREYIAIAFFTAVFYWALVGGLILLAAAKAATLEKGVLASILFGCVLALIVFSRVATHPKVIAKKKTRLIEQNLVHALRALLIYIKSGVPLFHAFEKVGAGGFGEVSAEFKKATDRINTGISEEDALQEIASDNPSLFFKRSAWQLANGLRAGADISSVLSEIVQTLTQEQKLQIQRFGGALRMLSLVYMLLGVIVPTLGVTFLIVLSSFAKISLGETVFWGLLAGLVLADFVFLGIMKSKRPGIITESS
ncbi:MAG TPA: type II secretion system F family protein [archaeon]|nr:type II secretion system F family protein [archaeon]